MCPHCALHRSRVDTTPDPCLAVTAGRLVSCVRRAEDRALSPRQPSRCRSRPARAAPVGPARGRPVRWPRPGTPRSGRPAQLGCSPANLRWLAATTSTTTLRPRRSRSCSVSSRCQSAPDTQRWDVAIRRRQWTAPAIAKTGLVIRPGTTFELIVPARFTSRLRIGWASLARPASGLWSMTAPTPAVAGGWPTRAGTGSIIRPACRSSSASAASSSRCTSASEQRALVSDHRKNRLRANRPGDKPRPRRNV